ncbi:NXPE family member 3-like [Branchiostoma lanceolatum]|uniref:NXPE family member 3-like n=1 Tax=Branchiostoma lanceolatum TaxID=7740 RepID=UPI003456877F
MRSPRMAAVLGTLTFGVLMSIMSLERVYFTDQPSPPTQKRIRLMKQVTDPNYTQFVVINPEREYRQGDVLTAVIVARDARGRPKTYGGDFFRAKLVSVRPREASSAGHVIDHGNGTYTVQFSLYWAGGVKASIQLVHPSEAVKVLQRVRAVPNKRIFFCSFVDAEAKIIVRRRCFSSKPASLLPHQLCDFSRGDENGRWFCKRPPSPISCSSISKCWWDGNKTYDQVPSLVSQTERKLFESPFLEEELKQDVPRLIRVKPSGQSSVHRLLKCSVNTPDVLSQGYWSRNVWKSSVCRVRLFGRKDVQRCLAKKEVYLQGDSTLRQWYLRLGKLVPLRSHGDSRAGPATGVNKHWKIAAYYRFHGFPIQVATVLKFRQIRYVTDSLDSIRGGPNTLIVLGLWAHFTAEPLEMFRARLFAIQSAICRLLRRSPGTRVFLRTGTTREHKESKLQFYMLGSDWLGYQITQEIRRTFNKEKNVVVLDTWDMSVCQWEPDRIHPGRIMIDSQLNMLLSHICPN